MSSNGPPPPQRVLLSYDRCPSCGGHEPQNDGRCGYCDSHLKGVVIERPVSPPPPPRKY